VSKSIKFPEHGVRNPSDLAAQCCVSAQKGLRQQALLANLRTVFSRSLRSGEVASGAKLVRSAIPDPPVSWTMNRVKPYRGFESHSLRQLAQGCVFSGQTRAQLGPVTAAIFHLGSGLPIDRAGILFSGRPFLSEALDSTHSVRFSIIEPLELLMNFIGKRFCRFCRTCGNV
jgi:hypothetical protein